MPGRGGWRRAAGLLGLGLGLSFLVFLLPELTGADPARAALRARTADGTPDAATVERLRRELGLDRPVGLRWLDFLAGALRGDLGISATSRTPVGPQLLRALQVSAGLVLLTVTVAVTVGLAAGTACAARAGGRLDRAVSAACRVAVAAPEFVVGPLLVLLVAVQLGLTPATGWGTPAQAVLPVLTLALFPLALVVQLTRAELLEVLPSTWVRAARARGLPERVVLAHALRASSASVTALCTLFVPGLLGGAVLVEVVFAVPGVGRLLYAAVITSDLPVAQAALLVLLGVSVAAALLGDLARRRLDPRLREASRA